MKELIKKLLGPNITKKLMPFINKKKEEKRTHFYSQFIANGDLCFDVGANIGNRTKPFLNLGAKVVAVEPQKACCNILKENFGDQITIIQKGVGDEIGEKDFYEADSPIISSFSEEWIEQVKKDRFKGFNWNEPIKLGITTLDAMIAEYGKPAFVKVDVEGFELEVFKGLSQPVKAMSFEYTIPEQTDIAVACIRQAEKVNKKATFNISKRESLKLALKEWISADEMCDLLHTKEIIESKAGDIYIRSNID